MPEGNRLDFDAGDDLEVVKSNLLKDVEAATNQAKKRKADDRAQDAKQKTQARDKTVMYIIVAVAAVVLVLVAYFMTFGRGSAESTVTQPTESRPTTTYQPPVQPQQRYAPQRQAPPPPSEPMRRTPTDTYDEGPATGGGM